MGILVLLILSGGIKRIAIFSEIAVPIMSVLYIVFCLGVIAVNYKNFGGAIKEIFIGSIMRAYDFWHALWYNVLIQRTTFGRLFLLPAIAGVFYGE